MTAKEVLAAAELAGCSVSLANGRPTVTGKPNAALMSALKQHREGIVSILSGDPLECSTCKAIVRPENLRDWLDLKVICELPATPTKEGGACCPIKRP